MTAEALTKAGLNTIGYPGLPGRVAGAGELLRADLPSALSWEGRHYWSIRSMTSFRRRNGGVHGGSK